MPGQPAWTLIEMLECNLPLCWAGGGDCYVGPAQIVWQPILFSLLSPLGLHVLIIEREAYWGSVFFSFLEQWSRAAVF